MNLDRQIRRLMNRFGSDRAGGMSIFGVFGVFMMVLVTALALEASNLYLARLKAQRIADLATLAAANTTQPIVNGAPSTTADATAKQVAAINGFTDVATRVITNSSGKQMISAEAQTPVTLSIGRLLTSDRSVDISGSSAASAGAQTGDCIRSLLGPVNIYNYAVIDGASCNLGAASFFYACQQANIKLLQVAVKYQQSWEAPYICPTASLTPAFPKFTFSQQSKDPLAGDSRITAIANRLKGMTSWSYGTTIPAKPLSVNTPNGQNATYNTMVSALTSLVKWGNLTVTNSVLTFTSSGMADPTCQKPLTISGNVVLGGTNRMIFGSGCYAIGGYLQAKDGGSTTFELLPNSDVTLVFRQYIQNGNGKLSFADMKISIQGSILNQSGGTLTFGNGPFMIGGGVANTSGVLSFGKGPYYLNGGTTTNGTGTLSFAGGAFYLWGGSLANQSSGTIAFGDGPFIFYGGTVTNVSGTMTFGRGNFEFWGGSLALDPGSTTAFGTGDMNMYGGTIYFLGDSITVGGVGDPQAGSSSIFFYGGSFSMKSKYFKAVGTTMAFYGGSVSLYGVGDMNITAPRGMNPAYGYKDILFYLDGGAFSLYQQNASDIFSGIVYVPKTNISIYGSQKVTLPDNGCFQVIGGIVDLYQSMQAKFAPCGDSNSMSSVSPLLVQ